MAEYLRPGVYYQRTDPAGQGRADIRSDIPAFIGIAERGPLDTPVPIDSFRQFQAHFGDFIGAGFLAYSVRAFFENGGRRCWVVRVASRDFAAENYAPVNQPAGLYARAARRIVGDGTEAVWAVEAFSPGSWGNALSVSMLEEHLAEAVIAIGDADADYARVSTTAGFARGTLVAIAQEDSAGALQVYHRVISHVDVIQQRLYWLHPDPSQALIYDQRLDGLDRNRPARVTSISYRINVFEKGRLLTSYANLHLIPEHPNYGPGRLAPYHFHTDGPAQQRAVDSPAPIVIKALHAQVSGIPARLDINPLALLPLAGGQDGLAHLSHRDFIGEDFLAADSDTQRQRKNRGIASLNAVEQITLVAIPDIVIQPEEDVEVIPEPPLSYDPCLACPPPPEKVQELTQRDHFRERPPIFSDDQIFHVQAALIAHCESRGDRFAVIDPPRHLAESAQSGIADIRAWRNRFDSDYAAIYFPWIKVIEPRKNKGGISGDSTIRAIPPSGHALGQYALFDHEVGAHRAPANRALQWCQDLTLHTTQGQQELLNPLGINVVRSEGPRGLRIMGARTLSSDPDWRYINVRRLLIMIRRALGRMSQWVVFEPNDHVTRNKYQIAISTYLETLWAQGALNGATAEAAFFVKCNEENNPAYQRNEGQLLVEIGVAPSQPFEFVIVRVGIQENELEIIELRDMASAA